MKATARQGIGRVQIERRLDNLRRVEKDAQVRGGWLSYMRHALGLSQRDLAKLVGLAPATVAQAEQREQRGTVTLAMMRKLATAMDCELIYAIVPRQSIEHVLRSRATAKAEAILRAADVHMTLEDQRVLSAFDDRVKVLVEELLASGDVW